jgi:hypothetical protein
MRWRPVAAALLPALYFLVLFAQDKLIAAYDTTNLFYVGKRWFWQQLKSGHFTYWNEYLFTGYSPLASPANGWLSPVSAVFYNLFSSVWAEQLQLPLFAALAGLGMYYWLARVCGSADAALMAALAFGLSGLLLSQADRSHIFYAVALYPWAFLFHARLLEGRRGSCGLLALTLAMILVHADWTGALLLACVLMVLAAGHRRAVLVTGASVAWAGILAAFALAPPLLNVEQSTRAVGFTLEQTSFYSFHPLRLLTLLLPEAWGEHAAGNFFGQSLANAYQAERFWFHSIFAGVPVLVLALCGFWQIRTHKRGYLLMGFCLGLLLLSFGSHFFLHEAVYNLFSLYRKLRFPEKFLSYVLFALFPLAALAAANRTKWKAVLLSCAAIHALAFLSYFFWPELAERASWLKQYGHLALAAVFAAMAWRSVVWPVLSAAVCVELLLFAPVQVTAPIESFETESPFAGALKRGRYLRDASIEGKTTANIRRSLQPNWPMLSGLKEVFGYESITPGRSERLTGAEVFRQLPSWAPVLNLTHVVSTMSPREKNLKAFAEQGIVKAVALDAPVNAVLLAINRKPRETELLCQFAAAAGEQEAFDLVRARGAAVEPLVVEGFAGASAAAGPCAGEIEVVSRTPDKRVYRVSGGGAPLWLVERESYAAGWSATLDGQPAKVWAADYINRGVYLPAGSGVVEIKFEPRGARAALILSLCGVLALLLYALMIWAKRTIPQLSR